eukprot:COSAG06_NODE_1186_length_10343_cov_19.170929_2_plen_78_part_00
MPPKRLLEPPASPEIKNLLRRSAGQQAISKPRASFSNALSWRQNVHTGCSYTTTGYVYRRFMNPIHLNLLNYDAYIL